jgi:alpha-galactosidase
LTTKMAIALVVLFATVAVMPGKAQGQLRNMSLALSVRPQDGSYQVMLPEIEAPVLVSRLAAEVNNHWLISTDYPRHHTDESAFNDELGEGRSLTTTFAGIDHAPDLVCVLRLYSNRPYGSVSVKLLNNTAAPVTVQEIRLLDAIGEPRINLGANESADRVMADSYSEDPPIRIGSLAQAPDGVYTGVQSVLVYNQAAQRGLLLAALTSNRFLTVSHLNVADAASATPHIRSFTIDSMGTTTKVVLERSEISRDQQIQLSLPLAPGQSLTSESVMIAGGTDYLAELEAYGEAVRQLHHARTSGPAPMGWWSWTAYYGGINQGEVLTNASWLADHLNSLGYDYLHIDEGYSYARGEFTTANATQFPDGMRSLEYKICNLGLTPGIWTAPFEVSVRAWVYQHHKDWLVHDAKGAPIQVGYVDGDVDPVFVLDTTHPDAQAYLRKTYEVLAHDWGIRYIKLDFMDHAAVEGYHYLPNTTALEAQRIGLQIIRDAVGNDVLIDKDGSPMLNPVGLVDEGRIANDTGHSFNASFNAAPSIAARFYMNRNFYRSDPDAFSVTHGVELQQGSSESKNALSLSDAEVQIVLAAVAGGLYEIGDDLPTLGSEPERLALVENQQLIDMNRLGQAALPLDLMTFAAEDLQPSVFFLPEDRRQTMLAVFNWTEQPRTHTFTLTELHLAADHPFHAYDVLRHDAPVALEGGTLRLQNQPPHSVRLIKLVDASVAEAAPTVTADVPATVRTGNALSFSAEAGHSDVPALVYRWSFGDGTAAVGSRVAHTYTKPGTYAIDLEVTGMDGIPARKNFTVKAEGLAVTRADLNQNRRSIPGSGW